MVDASASDLIQPIPERRGGESLPLSPNMYIGMFLAATFLFQILLVPQVLNPLRIPFRVGLYCCSLAMLILVKGTFRWTLAARFAVLINGIFCFQLLNPNNNSVTAAVATFVFNFAILSPVFWIGRLKLKTEHLRFVFLWLWAFNFASSGLGILEVYYPGRFGRDSKITEELYGDLAEGLKVTLANGVSVYRPMGLTDSPGGAASSGYITVLMATGLLLQRIGILLRFSLFSSIVCGLFCIYLCQVRSLMVLAGICEIVIIGVLALRGQLYRVTELLTILPFLLGGATLWAFSVGGEQVSNRISTLGEKSAVNVYYSNRGAFLEDTIFRMLPEYPLGAGLGRWGMMNQYFGDRGSNAQRRMWAEIQPTAWLLDGGLPLVVAYYLAIITCIVLSLRIALIRTGMLANYATVVLALNVATLANTLSYIPFIGQSGLTFWLINATFLGVDYHLEREVFRKRRQDHLQYLLQQYRG